MNIPDWLDDALDQFSNEEDNFMFDMENRLLTDNTDQIPVGVDSMEQGEDEYRDYFAKLVNDQKSEQNVKQSDPVVENPVKEATGAFPVTSFPKMDEDLQEAIKANLSDSGAISGVLGVQAIRNQQKILKKQEAISELLVKMITQMVQPVKEPTISGVKFED